MPDYYVYPSAVGDNDGGADGAANDPTDANNWTDAWTNIQSAFDTADAGDIVYCRGTQTFADATTIDVDQATTGTNAGGFIKFIGVNATTGAIDGSRFIINVNSKACHGITFAATADMYWFENIEVKNAGAGGDSKSGWYSAAYSSAGMVFVNCCANTCSGYGFGVPSTTFTWGSRWIQCVAYSNTLGGFINGGVGNLFAFCCARDNSGDGFNIDNASPMVWGCIAYHNTDMGFDCGATAGATIIQCVIDSNDNYGINYTAGTALYSGMALACRITDTLTGHTAAGIDCNAEAIIMGWNYFDEAIGDANAVIDDAIAQVIKGSATYQAGAGTTDTNLYNQDDTNQGYVDADATPDFSTGYTSATDPIHRRVGLIIPWT